MSRATIAPLHEWQRHHPLAHEIAADIPAPMLALSTGQLIADVRQKYGCGETTACTAVGIARRAAFCAEPALVIPDNSDQFIPGTHDLNEEIP